MKIAPVADVKAHFSEYVKESKKGPFQRVLREAREEIRATGGIEHEEFWRDLER